ncbi:Protein CBG24832 [Caenorhabditis briggsae]|uniref:Protein CBG24832 n=2 Tax=Caenorhabditis briggsae TaxID=6238 RepID=A8WLL3_CAEBR|nr:Protein CBG24832 [Caenorhabditis briggsae]CAP21358.1 Protein CBG24832 [Caenorhabditis briggsae]
MSGNLPTSMDVDKPEDSGIQDPKTTPKAEMLKDKAAKATAKATIARAYYENEKILIGKRQSAYQDRKKKKDIVKTQRAKLMRLHRAERDRKNKLKDDADDLREKEDLYCFKCKIKTNTLDVQSMLTKNSRAMIKGKCEDCSTTKCKIISKEVKSGGSTKDLPEPEDSKDSKDRILLEKTYYSPKTGFCGINELSRVAKVSQKKAKEFLDEQDVYTLHKPARKNFKSQRVYVSGIDDQWQSDLVEMIPYASENHDFKNFGSPLPSSTENVHPAPCSPPNKSTETFEFKTPSRARSALSSPMNNFLNGGDNDSPTSRPASRLMQRLEQKGTIRRDDEIISQEIRRVAETNLSRSPSLASLRGSIQNLSIRGSHLNLAGTSGELPPNLTKFASVNSPARQSLSAMEKTTDRQAAVLERLGRLRESLHAGKNYTPPRSGFSSSRITTPAQTPPISPRPVS